VTISHCQGSFAAIAVDVTMRDSSSALALMRFAD
jgi:hypothetical protein